MAALQAKEAAAAGRYDECFAAEVSLARREKPAEALPCTQHWVQALPYGNGRVV
jgi:hypothetical protein